MKKDEGVINPAPGTVLDKVITGSKDFYLISHKAIKVSVHYDNLNLHFQGSPKPVHCHIHLNEPKMEMIKIQHLLFRLSHLHPGCACSVSLPMPLYNAHKLAYRVGQVYRPYYESVEDASSGSSEEPKKIDLSETIKSTFFFL